MPSVSFQFGSARHTVRIECGMLGKEQYFVNDKLVLSLWSFRLRGVRQFVFEGHRIEVRVWMTLTQAHGEAFVDGEKVASDLFADFNAQFPRLPDDPPAGSAQASGVSFLSKLGVWLALMLAILVAIRYGTAYLA